MINRVLVAFVLLGLLVPGSYAADLAGSRDHPLLKRFGGSEIVAYDQKRFDVYELQTSTFKSYSLSTNTREFASPPLKLEGTVTRIWYEAAGDASAVEVIRNYQNEMKSAGFEVLYDSSADRSATRWVNFLAPFSQTKINSSRGYYIFYAADKDGIRTLSAVLKRAEGDVYVYLTAVDWAKDDAVYKAKRGAYVAVDIIEVKPMVQNMILVSADGMSSAIKGSGRVALYGILFDFNRAEIKPESKPTLEQIAKLMQQDAKLKLWVVGHTDNVGDLSSNMDLSRRRAEAVVAALTRDYGVAASRLSAQGVAFLAPVAVNTTDEGRAKNRRVELVPW
ncbi:MAG: OmpA family protein [Acidobacteriota bacterium]